MRLDETGLHQPLEHGARGADVLLDRTGDWLQHYALTATLAFTGLRFCHASALEWDDIDEAAGVIHIRRSQVRGEIGVVSRKKRAPKQYPLVPELAQILREHRKGMLKKQVRGLQHGWVFPSRTGGLRKGTSTMDKAWAASLKAAGIDRRFTVHGLRRTFNDLARRAGVDAVTTRSLTGHVTERMQEHYSTVRLDEQRAAVAGVVHRSVDAVWTEVWTRPETRTAR